ncbi:hypothetical protein PENSPDRAFT_659714 [Peniophora sp. CONT]|nr:hypothetical protein PENSPDRAFT_659714 [Peniophora sp. CONT]
MAAMVDADTTDISNTTPAPDESSRNALRPSILQLPPELLSLVVIFAAESEPPRSPVSSEDRENAQMPLDSRAFWDPIVQGGSLGWIRLCHVCRLWRRHICEGMPLLWAQVVGCFRLCGAFEEMLRRAGASIPLSVQSFYGQEPMAVYNPPWVIVESPVQTWSQSESIAFRGRVRHLRIVDMQVAKHLRQDPSQLTLDDMINLETLEVHYLLLNSVDVSEGKLIS